MKPKLTHYSSSNRSDNLVLDEDLNREYQFEHAKLNRLFRQKMRDKHGIYADNQDKFVKSVEELNQFDSRIFSE